MSTSTGAVRLPDAPVLVAGFAGAAWLDTTGEVLLLTPQDAARRQIYPLFIPGAIAAVSCDHRLTEAPAAHRFPRLRQ